MTRHDWIFLVSTLAVIAALIGMILHYEGIERQNCIVRGGRVVDVRGGRGGWICAPESR